MPHIQGLASRFSVRHRPNKTYNQARFTRCEEKDAQTSEKSKARRIISAQASQTPEWLEIAKTGDS
jgi:hypothetical protein